jgi:uncharacterized RDD family membrane protein YckC
VEEGSLFCQSCGQQVGAAATAKLAAASALPPPITGTPNAPMSLPYAGFWARFAAYLIDGLILGIPFIFVVMFVFLSGVLGMTLHRRPVDPHEAAVLLGPMFLFFFLFFLGFVVLQWLYFAVMESSVRQATFGKSVMSLRVTDDGGQRISFGRATGRFFAKIVSGMVPLLIGYIMAAFTEKKQALHDLIAGTLVLRQ